MPAKLCDSLGVNHPFTSFVKTEINTPSQSTFIADHNSNFIFFIVLSCAKLWAFECKQYANLFQPHTVRTYIACKF